MLSETPNADAVSRPEKVGYVKRQRQDRHHTCHWPGCERQVPPALWGCKPHWLRLPKRLRDQIWDAYVPGQEQRMDPSDDYLVVAHEVQQWIAEHAQNDGSGADC